MIQSKPKATLFGFLKEAVMRNENPAKGAAASKGEQAAAVKRSAPKAGSQAQEQPSGKRPQSGLANIPNQNSNIGQTNLRILTLKQLKELFDDIYAQKAKFDKRVQEGKAVKETMEQFMYTYLNTKYGLKNLIVEWACGIVNGIKKFASKDNDVALFGLVLRNECDEEFKLVQNQVKTTIKELLKVNQQQFNRNEWIWV